LLSLSRELVAALDPPRVTATSRWHYCTPEGLCQRDNKGWCVEHWGFHSDPFCPYSCGCSLLSWPSVTCHSVDAIHCPNNEGYFQDNPSFPKLSGFQLNFEPSTNPYKLSYPQSPRLSAAFKVPSHIKICYCSA
jgi:hypothetical protein